MTKEQGGHTNYSTRAEQQYDPYFIRTLAFEARRQKNVLGQLRSHKVLEFLVASISMVEAGLEPGGYLGTWGTLSDVPLVFNL